MKKIYIPLIILMLLFLHCGMFEPEIHTGNLIVEFVPEQENTGLQKKSSTSLSAVQCIVKKGSTALYDLNLTHNGSSYETTIEGLEEGSDYSVVLYGKDSDSEVIARAYHNSITINAGKTTTASVSWRSFCPTLSSPSYGNSSDDDTPYFSWYSVSGSDGYQLQVDDYSTFYSPVIDMETSYTSYTSSSLSDDTYYWRVRCKDDEGVWGDWSEVWSFMIETTLAAPTLRTPINGELTYTDTPEFDWSYISSASKYELLVDDSYSFTDPEIDEDYVTNSKYQDVDNPLLLDTYYWKVRAANSSGTWGDWSSTASCKVNILDLTASDFEDWSINTSDGYILSDLVYVEEDGATIGFSPSYNYLRLKDLTYDGWANILFNIPRAKSLTVKFKWYVSDVDDELGFQMWDTQATVEDNSIDEYYKKFKYGPWVDFADGDIEAKYYEYTNSTFEFNEYDLISDFTARNIYNMELNISCEYKNYDVKIDGSWVMYNVPFCGKNAEALDGFRFLVYSNRTCNYGDIVSIYVEITEYEENVKITDKKSLPHLMLDNGNTMNSNN